MATVLDNLHTKLKAAQAADQPGKVSLLKQQIRSEKAKAKRASKAAEGRTPDNKQGVKHIDDAIKRRQEERERQTS